MKTVGAYEAKTHLSELLEQVARGERITITRHGVPVARLVPVDLQQGRSIEEVIEEIWRFRKGRRITAAELRELVEEGRRH
jgi:prevent-host-death family protein